MVPVLKVMLPVKHCKTQFNESSNWNKKKMETSNCLVILLFKLTEIIHKIIHEKCQKVEIIIA